MNQDISSRADSSSRKVSKAEANATAKLNKAMARKLNRLQSKLRSNWNSYQNLDKLPRQRAIDLSKVLVEDLDLSVSGSEKIFRDLYQRSQSEGISLAQDLLKQIGVDDVKNANTNDFVDFWTSDSKGRLVDWTKAFQRDATAIFELGMSQGWTSKQVNDALLSRFGKLQQQTERIVRTASPAVTQSTTSAIYDQNGITLVLWITSLTDRVCLYCSLRHGNVYYLKDIIFPLHPREQCNLAPLKRRNLLYDLDRNYWKQEKAKGLQQLRDAGGKPNYGASPFEKKAGRNDAPKPVWQPDKGYSYGEKSKTRRVVDE